jgi:hypothetical protein
MFLDLLLQAVANAVASTQEILSEPSDALQPPLNLEWFWGGED